MAIDTAEKRRSAGGVPFLPLGVNVTPNASKDREWRQQVAWSYSGIAAAVASLAADYILSLRGTDIRYGRLEGPDNSYGKLTGTNTATKPLRG